MTSLHYTPDQPNMLNLFIDPDATIDGTASFLRIEFPYSSTGDGFEKDLGTGLGSGAEIDCIDSTGILLVCRLYHSTNKPYIWIAPPSNLTAGTIYDIKFPGIKNPSKPTSIGDTRVDIKINV
jgi:hypothetical protein